MHGGEVGADFLHQLVFLGIGIIRGSLEGLGDGHGVGDEVNLVAVRVHNLYLFLLLINIIIAFLFQLEQVETILNLNHIHLQLQ